MSAPQENTPNTTQPVAQTPTTSYQFQYVPQYPLHQPYPQSQAQLQHQMQMQMAQQPLTPASSLTSSQLQTTPTATPATTQQSAIAGPGPSTTAAAASSSTATTQGQSSTTPSAAQQAQAQRQAAEQARKDRTLAEFLLMLDDYEPLIPNEVTDYYLQRVGFECEDVRLKRLMSLAAQKFVSDIAADAYQHARIRTNAAAGGRGRAPGGQSIRDKTRTTLTMEDLSAALSEYGINARKPDFYM